MKKNYLTICLGAFIIMASVLLFPVTAHSQELTAAQKQERCQNNKNRIAELEPQLIVINAELSQTMEPKEMEKARTDMVYVRSMKKEEYMNNEDGRWTKLERIGAHYNFDYSECVDRIFYSIPESYRNAKDAFRGVIPCLTELEKIIAKKINKAESLNRPALLAKKNEIDKQIAQYRNNLLKWECEGGISGTWSFECCGKTYSGKMYLKQVGNKISGNFGETSNASAGDVTGSVNGNTVIFTRTGAGWTQDFTLTLSSDGKSLTGNFTGYPASITNKSFSAKKL